MSNSYFQFKHFTIHQDKCAMKVCTDSCLFGAFVANELQNKKSVLDIGSGTGLLSLMYAQKNKSEIDAVEIDENAFNQSQENILSAKFESIIKINHGSIIDFSKEATYDLIICNPPFYKNSLKGEDEIRNKALHNDELTYEILFAKAKYLLKNDGVFALLIPFSLTKKCIDIASQNELFCNKSIAIKQSTTHNYFRSILFFSAANNEIAEQSISIKENQKAYTPEFVNLLKDFYLFL
jgi:tRNA1Val (adenine37-N6)-methyltransferase